MSARPVTDRMWTLLREIGRHESGASAEILAGQVGWSWLDVTTYLAILVGDRLAETTYVGTSAIYRATPRGRMLLARGTQLTLAEELARVG